MPPPEDDVDPDGAVSSAIVEDSDDDDDRVIPTPSITPVAQVVVSTASLEKVVEAPAAPAPVEEKKKRVITKKSTV